MALPISRDFQGSEPAPTICCQPAVKVDAALATKWQAEMERAAREPLQAARRMILVYGANHGPISEIKYFKDAYVIPVEDKAIGRRVGVIARPVAEAINIEHLRNDLVCRVSPHMLPTAFRSLGPDEVIPLTCTDKIAKVEIMKQFFSCDAEGKLPRAVEVIDLDFQ